MGMYTQARGWLNVDSIGDYEGKHYREICKILSDAKVEFVNSGICRAWVCQDTYAHEGCNGSVYIFFGTELKNYNDSAEEWIKFLVSKLPNAEGQMNFFYEEDDRETVWKIAHGKIISETTEDAWCEGYGNMWNYNK